MASRKSPLPWLIAVALLCAVPAPARTLKLATLAPDGTTWMKEMRAGAKEVAARTRGRVKFKFYPGGVMGNDKTVLRKIRARQLHGGAFSGGGLRQVYPGVDLYSMPFLFRSLAEVDYVRARVDGAIRRELEARGMVVLGISEGGFGYLMSDAPLRTLDDVQRKKVWIPEGDPISQTALKAAGIPSVPLSIADVYTALQTGLVDTVVATPAAAIAFQWHTRIRYLTDLPLSYLVGIVVVDKSAFERLSADDQAVVREVMGGVLERLGRKNRQDNERAMAALRAQGVEIVRPEPGPQLDRWRRAGDETIQRLRAGGAYSKELFDAVLGYLEAYRAGTGQGG